MVQKLVGKFRSYVKSALERVLGQEINKYNYAERLGGCFDHHGIDCLIDIGCHEGQFARFARGFFSGQILSFEPLSGPYQLAIRSAEKRGDKKWRVYNFGVGPLSTKAVMNVSAGDGSSSSLLLPRTNSGIAIARTEDVAISPIRASIVSRFNRLCVKMDVQGYELLALDGCSEILAKTKLFVVEASNKPAYELAPEWIDLINHFRQIGFEPVFLKHNIRSLVRWSSPHFDRTVLS
jgi:FkbM family methyltransferase